MSTNERPFSSETNGMHSLLHNRFSLKIRCCIFGVAHTFCGGGRVCGWVSQSSIKMVSCQQIIHTIMIRYDSRSPFISIVRIPMLVRKVRWLLTRQVVNTGWLEIEIHNCYTLVKIAFAPICACKNNRRI